MRERRGGVRRAGPRSLFVRWKHTRARNLVSSTCTWDGGGGGSPGRVACSSGWRRCQVRARAYLRDASSRWVPPADSRPPRRGAARPSTCARSRRCVCARHGWVAHLMAAPPVGARTELQRPTSCLLACHPAMAGVAPSYLAVARRPPTRRRPPGEWALPHVPRIPIREPSGECPPPCADL